jgi:uncharacterized protein (TIGR00299 family) protein
MSTTLYLDLCSGISGDMLLAALFDLGVCPEEVETELRKLPLAPWHWHVYRATQSGLAGLRVEVHGPELPQESHPSLPPPAVSAPSAAHAHPHAHHGPGPAPARSPLQHQHNSFKEIEQLILQSPLSDWVRHTALAVFRRIAEAEARIHGCSIEAVHFHEVGAVDSIVDIVGGCVALEKLGRPRILASAVVDGTGFLECAHGRLPLPAPATLAILGARGIPLSQCDESHELVTPTGAAFLAELVESFGPMHQLVAERIGYGLGARTLRTRPNVLRAILGRQVATTPQPHDWETDLVAVLETNLDDATGESIGHFMETALRAGALDVFCVPVQMKKNRPGVLLTVLCAPQQADHFTALILRETPALGVRRSQTERRKLRRRLQHVGTPYGPVAVKVAELDGRILHAKPEWHDCQQRAEEHGLSAQEVWRAACAAAQKLLEKPHAGTS